MSKVRNFGKGLMIKYEGSVGKNRGRMGQYREFGEVGYGWWRNWGIFGSLRSWVKYGGHMEGVGKCG